MMCLIEIVPFGCGGLGNAHPTQPYAVILSVAFKEITTFHIIKGKKNTSSRVPNAAEAKENEKRQTNTMCNN